MAATFIVLPRLYIIVQFCLLCNITRRSLIFSLQEVVWYRLSAVTLRLRLFSDWPLFSPGSIFKSSVNFSQILSKWRWYQIRTVYVGDRPQMSHNTQVCTGKELVITEYNINEKGKYLTSLRWLTSLPSHHFPWSTFEIVQDRILARLWFLSNENSLNHLNK